MTTCNTYTLNNLKDTKGLLPYTSPVKVKVIAKGSELVSKTGNKYCPIGVADSTGVRKVILHDLDKTNVLTVGKTVLLRNFTVNNSAIMINKTSKIFKTGEMDVPTEHQRTASNMINPPTALQKDIKDVLNGPPGTLVSICGLVIEEAMAVPVNVKGEEVLVKEIKLEQDGSSITVSLWRNYTQFEISIGQFVEFDNVAIKMYNNRNVANTTSRTVIRKSDIPVRQYEVKVLGYEDGDLDLVLTCEVKQDIMDFKVAVSELKSLFKMDDDVVDVREELERKIPFDAKLTVQGSNIVSVS